MAASDIHTVVVNLDNDADPSPVQQAVEQIVRALDANATVERRDLGEGGVQLQVLVRGEPAAATAREQIAGHQGVRDAFVKPPDALP